MRTSFEEFQSMHLDKEKHGQQKIRGICEHWNFNAPTN